MSLPLRDAIESAGRYVARNPRIMLKLLSHAANLRLAVPLDALRWLASHLLTGKSAPADVIITARPPALSLGATVEYMKQKIRISASISIDDLRAGPGELEVALRVQDLAVKPFDPKSPLNQLIKSGALDLKKPANLLNFLGKKKPAAVVEAVDDRFTLDLMEIPAVSANPIVERVLAALTPVVGIQAIRTDGDLLVIAVNATPAGLPQALASLRG